MRALLALEALGDCRFKILGEKIEPDRALELKNRTSDGEMAACCWFLNMEIPLRYLRFFDRVSFGTINSPAQSLLAAFLL